MKFLAAAALAVCTATAGCAPLHPAEQSFAPVKPPEPPRLDDAATIASGAMFFTWQHQDAAKKLKARVRRLCG
jgi:hypothetical protein